MKLPWFLSKRGIMEHVARRQGRAFAEEHMDWLKKNKVIVAHVWAAVAVAAAGYQGKYSPQVMMLASIVSAFLYGAGVIDSDKTQAARAEGRRADDPPKGGQ